MTDDDIALLPPDPGFADKRRRQEQFWAEVRAGLRSPSSGGAFGRALAQMITEVKPTGVEFEPSPILFLDFDGVLHPVGRDAERFCRVELLWQLLRACPLADVVFSTSWRESYTFEQMLEFVTYGGGEDLADRFVGMTPILDPAANREAECLAWLRASGSEPRRWLALDDAAHWFETPNLYLVDQRTGLTTDDVETIAERLWNDPISGY